MGSECNRFKNYGVWVSILALIPMILNLFGIDIVPENFKEISTAILSILVTLGIISNPTTQCKWYVDDKLEEKNKI